MSQNGSIIMGMRRTGSASQNSVSEPVVVGHDALGGEGGVHLVEEDVAVEAQDVLVQQLVVDADLVGAGQALLGVEGGGQRLFQVAGCDGGNSPHDACANAPTP